MVKHIILWTLKDSLSEEEKIQIKKSIKEGLESLQGVVPGLTDIKVQIDGRLASSNADLMLDSHWNQKKRSKAMLSTRPM